MDIGSGYPAVGNVTDDGDSQSLDLAFLFADGQKIEQALCGMLVKTVPRVNDRGIRHVSQHQRHTRAFVPNHQRVDGHGL